MKQTHRDQVYYETQKSYGSLAVKARSKRHAEEIIKSRFGRIRYISVMKTQ